MAIRLVVLNGQSFECRARPLFGDAPRLNDHLLQFAPQL
jgi:hypothetical protein